jgi:hypothetical protein
MKVAMKQKGPSRVRAQFLAAGTAIARGVMNLISRAKISKDGENKYDHVLTAVIGSSKPFSVLGADIRGAYTEYVNSLTDKKKALPLLVDDKGSALKPDAEEGFLNEKLEFQVENGTLGIAV